MKQKETYFKVGLFVLLCTAGLVAGLMFIGTDVLGKKVVLVETYIDESVQGLNVGSAVLHRGVNIGQVERITFVPIEYPMEPDSPEFRKFGRYVMVVMVIDPRKFPGVDSEPDMVIAMLRNQVSLGLRFKLSYQGITGISYIEADYVDPQRNPELQVPWKPKYIYISSAPSLFTSFTHAIESVFQRLEKIDFEGLVAQLGNTFAAIETTLQDAEVGQIRQAIVDAIEDIKETNQYIQSLLERTDSPMPGNIPQAVDAFRSTLSRLDELLARHEIDIDDVMANLKILIRNLRQVSESIKDSPAQLLFAAPPEKSELVQ
ncbi:MAG: MCE family protein [Planctomycetes bacterium]|nr:MCE family protein [Planctomycetota bacterium]